jgi:uncharacterized damage-inducible protein DinB
MDSAKGMLHHYLQAQREALLWKLDGLDDYALRRPMTPTGTNLLGLVKHVGSVELDYFGNVFGRPPAEETPWMAEGAEDNADMFATPDQDLGWVTGFYRRAWRHADATIDALELDAPAVVPWWEPASRNTDLHRILVHVIAETARHAGHADILRETLDGQAGLGAGNSNLPGRDEAWWRQYREKLEAIARNSGR